jgi:phospholipid/cholesterol/gamma-HCH transport system ATP-binding protein
MNSKIEIYGLCKKLNNKTVLDGMEVKIIEGETFAIIGQSGVGKSVLIKHMIGLMTPDSGEIYIDGEKINYDDDGQWDSIRKKFGMLFQGGALFDSLSVGENILFSLDNLRPELHEQEKQEKMLRSLELVELPGTENLMIPSLSGGMMKRVALARAIVAEPSIVLFDEPTTGLDPITTANINELILSLKKKLQTTFIIVTHDIRSAKYVSDRIGMIYKGKLIFTGTPEELDKTDDPFVLQFIQGKSHGPITDEYNSMIKKMLEMSAENNAAGFGNRAQKALKKEKS